MRVQDRTVSGASYPLIHLFPMKSRQAFNSGSYRLAKTYQVAMAFLLQDKDDSLPEDQIKLTNQADLFVTEYITNLNERVVSGNDFSADVELSNIVTEPIYRITGDITTGLFLSFSLTVPDDFNYCCE